VAAGEVLLSALLSTEEIVAAARDAKASGASRFCMGAAWRSPTDKQVDAVASAVRLSAGRESMSDELQTLCLHAGANKHLPRRAASHRAERGPEPRPPASLAEALRSRGLECLGFVIGSWPDSPDLAMRTIPGPGVGHRLPAAWPRPCRRGAVEPGHLPCRPPRLDHHRLTRSPGAPTGADRSWHPTQTPQRRPLPGSGEGL
jgi:hypothetical protein